MVKLRYQSSEPRLPVKKRVTGELRDVIIDELEEIAAKHRVALSTIVKMGFAEVRSRAA